MKVIRERMFQRESLRAPGAFEGIRFERCVFSGCNIGLTTYAGWRVQIRNIEVVGCSSLAGTRVGPAIAEDCLIDGLQTDERITALAQPLLKHVTIRGRIGKLGIGDKPVLPISGQSKREYEALEAALTAEKNAFYSTVDWALDIREAEVELFEMSGIPLHLVHRDPETQMILLREKIDDPTWRDKLSSGNWWVRTLGGCSMADLTEREFLLVAPKNTPPRKYQKIFRDLQELREKGFIKPE